MNRGEAPPRGVHNHPSSVDANRFSRLLPTLIEVVQKGVRIPLRIASSAPKGTVINQIPAGVQWDTSDHIACPADFITAPLECFLTYTKRTLGAHFWLASLHCAGLACPLFGQALIPCLSYKFKPRARAVRATPQTPGTSPSERGLATSSNAFLI